jgi:4-hydroxybenzoate polyprenyltransferase
VTGEIRRTAAVAMVVLTGACGLGLAWFLGDTGAALITWRMD